MADRSSKELKKLPPGASNEEVIAAYNELVDQYNYTVGHISLRDNLDGQIKTVSIPAGSSVRVSHFLGDLPSWRIILRQEGNGIISDVPSGWNDKFITLKNNGSEVVKISLLIARE